MFGYVVLSARDVLTTKAFYEVLGLTFVQERHGAGPTHYAATLENGMVLEIYPIKGDVKETFAEPRRIGWIVSDRDATFLRLAMAGYKPSRSTHGSCIVRDPDGRVLELLNPSS